MKTTKRARKNQARQKLKLDSERITKDANQNIETPEELMHSLSDVVHYALTIIFAMILSSLLFFVVSKQFDDHLSKQLANRTTEPTETVSKNVVGSLVDSFIGNEPLNETKSENTEYAIIKKHQIERIEIDNFTYPTVTQVLERVFDRVFYTSENRSANHKTIKQEVQIPRDEIIENLSKKPSYLASMDSSRSSRIQQDIDELANAIYNVGYQEEREGKIINVYERSKERDALIALVENYKESKIDEKAFKKSLNEFKPKYIKAVNETINQQNATEPTNEDYQKVLASNIHYLEYINTVNKDREDLSNNANNDDKEIRRVRVVPAAGFETKENIFVDIVNYESDKQPSKDEIAENLSKQSAYLMSLKYREGKLKLAAAERENQKIANEEPNIDDAMTIIKEHGLTLAYLFFVMVGLLLYSEHRKEKKIRLTYIEDDESQSEAAPAILKINNNKDLTRYSNKL